MKYSVAAAIVAAACVSAPTAAAAPARFDWFEYRADDGQPKPGPREYSNPILRGFYPDPSITRAGDDFYLVTSTFCWFPGLPVFHSRDLVHWTQIGNAIDRPSQLKFAGLGLSRGVFAPDISWHAGTFYILNTCVDCGGNYLITAKDPRGPWSDPVWLPELEGGIDPSLFFDEDGSAWVVNNGPPPGTPLYDGHRALWIQRIDLQAKKLVGPRTLLVNGGVNPAAKPIWIEGPHIFGKDGWYYLIAAEGGTAENHSEVVLRSRSVTGPYEALSGNPILTQRNLPKDRPNPITSAGHADFVQTRNGEWWATFLATRPYRDDNYNTGRETFLLPVTWQDGWPSILPEGQAIPRVHKRPNLAAQQPSPVPTNGDFTVRDEFSQQKLAPYWMMMRQPRERWWSIDKGQLALSPRAVALGDVANPSLLARRQQHLHASATTLLGFDPKGSAEAGIVALQSDEYWYSLTLAGGRSLRVKVRAGPDQPKAGRVLAETHVPAGPLYLRISADADRYSFAWSSDGRRFTLLLSNADGTILSTKRAGGFVGAVFGLYAYDPEGTQ